MLARVTIALLVRQGVVQLTMVLCGVLLARALGPAEFGVYVLCTFLASFLMIVGDLGLVLSSRASAAVLMITCGERPSRCDRSLIFVL